MDVGGRINNNKVLESSLFIGLVLLLVWIPLPLASNRPWSLALFEVWVFTLAALWGVAWLRGQSEISPALRNAKPVLYMFAAWLVYLVLQILPFPYSLVAVLSPARVEVYARISGDTSWLSLSQDPHTTKVYFLKSLAYVQLFLLVLLLVNTKQRLKVLAYTIVYCALFQAVYGSLMVLSGLEYGFLEKKLHGIGNATGTFVNRNHLAGYLEMSLAVGIGLLIASLGNGKRVGSLKQRLRNTIQLIFSSKFRLRFYLAFMVIALVLTHSRMGNTAFFSSLIIAGVTTLFITRHATRSTTLLLTSLIVIDMFIVGTWFGIDKVAERLEKTSMDTEIRMNVNEYAMAHWKDYLLTGSGAGTFSVVFTKYKGQDIRLYFDHAHNDYLEVATETGIIGIALLAGIVLISLSHALQALRKRREPLMIGMAFACVMGAVSIMIHSVVDFNLQIPTNAVTFLVVLSLGFISQNMKLNSKRYQ